MVLDGGANKGVFSKAVAARFPVRTIAVEADPILAATLRAEGLEVAECALGDHDKSAAFHLGENDETSSLMAPSSNDGLLVVRDTVTVRMRTLEDVLAEHGLERVSCVKLDIESGEIAVLNGLAARAEDRSPMDDRIPRSSAVPAVDRR